MALIRLEQTKEDCDELVALGKFAFVNEFGSILKSTGARFVESFWGSCPWVLELTCARGMLGAIPQPLKLQRHETLKESFGLSSLITSILHHHSTHHHHHSTRLIHQWLRFPYQSLGLQFLYQSLFRILLHSTTMTTRKHQRLPPRC